VGVEGEQGAVKNELVAARYADGGEVLDFQIAERVGLVLDVDPAELGLRELLREGEKPGPVLDAGIAPFCAKAADDEHG